MVLLSTVILFFESKCSNADIYIYCLSSHHRKSLYGFDYDSVHGYDSSSSLIPHGVLFTPSLSCSRFVCVLHNLYSNADMPRSVLLDI